MNHPINPLSEAGLDMLCDRLTDFTVAYEGLWHDEQRDQGTVMERCLRILPSDLYNELNAYLGSMRDHINVVSELLYGQVELLASDGLVSLVSFEHELLASDGLVSPTDGATSRYPDDALPRFFNQLDRGVITQAEFEQLVAVYWSERGMAEASELDRCDWMYAHQLLDNEHYGEALEEAWVEHVIGPCGDTAMCLMHACSTADQFRVAHIARRQQVQS